MRHNYRRRRLVRAAFFFGVLGFPIASASAVTAVLHARLIRSTPAADARLTRAPDSLRLVFSEAVVAELSQIAVTKPDGSVMQLRVALDPRDSHVLIAPFGLLPGGNHRVAWRIVSADGHPVAGNFSFSIAASADDPVTTSPADSGSTPFVAAASASDSGPSSASTEMRTPRLASALRGFGLGAMMAGVGLLFFGSAAGSRRNLDPRSFVTRLFTIGAVLLAAHMAAWLYHISPGRGLSETYGTSALLSTLGTVELARVTLATLALWAIAKGRARIALLLGLACLAVSGSVGHSAAVLPVFAIPAKIIHLISASIWVGGLLWIVWTFRRDVTAFRIEARRVSSAALFALIAVVFTGAVQTQLFLGWPWDLFGTDYGRLVLAKIGGLIVLTLLGGYNRFRLVPQLDDSRKGARLSRSVMQELVILTAILLISGFLANVPIPPPT